MQDIFITKIKINEVRNIKDFEINLSETERKHLIITGKNGSEKTSFLESLKDNITPDKLNKSNILQIYFNDSSYIENNAERFQYDYSSYKTFILKYFGAKRDSEFIETKGVQKIDLHKLHNINDQAGKYFTQHIVNLQFDKLFAADRKDSETVKKINHWFINFEKKLGDLFDEPEFKLLFDIETYSYLIIENGNPPYNFNQLPDGYSAILDIVSELIMRMELRKGKSYDVQGVVLIDEIETHLHIDLQKKILPFLTSFFPKIQFIVTTHSPFVLSSIENAVICDLEKRIVTEDLSVYSWEAIVESYFDSDQYSDELKKKIARYEDLLNKESLNENEKDELLDLKIYFSSVPTIFADELAIKLNELNLKAIAKNKK